MSNHNLLCESCPECGNKGFVNEDDLGDGYRVCDDITCSQEWWTNIRYDVHVDYKLEIDELRKVIQMCFDDACSSSGKIKKKTALALMKYADTRA